MFGHNQIVGVKFFKDAPAKQLMVTSMFMTLQGEGPYRGHPAYFVRLAMCNLSCSFCDTFFDKGDWMTFEEIEARMKDDISKFFDGDVPSWARWQPGQTDIVLVVTGGEPTLQSNLVDFFDHFKNKFKTMQVESNGTQPLALGKEVTLVVSPKCLEKGGKAVRYLEPNQKTLDRADCLKFVMCEDQDSPYSSVPEWAHTWRLYSGKPVFVSPMNIYNDLPEQAKKLRAEKDDITIEERSTVDEVISWWEPGLLNMEDNQKNHEYTARYCIQNGFIFNMQQHLFAGVS